MVTTVTSYQTSDGQNFPTEAEAKAHEAVLARAAEVEDFLDAFYPKPETGKPGPARSIAKKAVVTWIAENSM